MKATLHNGDDGKTSFIGQGRLWKDDARIQALGSLDEARSALGIVRAFAKTSYLQQLCLKLQSALGLILAEIATDKPEINEITRISACDLQWIEEKILEIDSDVKQDSGFLIPGSSRIESLLDFARVSIRKAERDCIKLIRLSVIDNPILLAWINRASSLIFVLEKREAQKSKA